MSCDFHGKIAMLREYRTQLVADVVMGKLDVRPAALYLLAVADKESPDLETFEEDVTETEDAIEPEETSNANN